MIGIRAFKKSIELSFEWRLAGYNVIDTEGNTVAPVLDLLCDEDSRKPRYLMAEIGGLMGIQGKVVLLPIGMLTRAGSGQVIANSTREQMQQAEPLDDPDNPKRREEEKIFIHYGLRPYWEVEEVVEASKEAKKEAEKDAEKKESEDEGAGPKAAGKTDA
ncbi:MAG: PRC-barrel domain-containing protein [Nitrospinota bacterium]